MPLCEMSCPVQFISLSRRRSSLYYPAYRLIGLRERGRKSPASKQVMLESAAWLSAQKAGEHEASTNAPCNSIVEPDMDLHWFLTTSPVNFSRHKDTVIDELYAKQSRATDDTVWLRE